MPQPFYGSDVPDAAAAAVNQLRDDVERLAAANRVLERRLADALVGKVEDPHMFDAAAIWTKSIISAQTGEPKIEFRWSAQICQMTVAEAQDFAHTVLLVVAAAEADAFLFNFIAGQVGAGPAAGAQMLVAFRQFRDRLADEPDRRAALTGENDG